MAVGKIALGERAAEEMIEAGDLDAELPHLVGDPLGLGEQARLV